MPNVDEGKEPVVEEIQADEHGRFPEAIPWSKYIGIKEAWGRAKEKVVSLEEQLKTAISTDEFNKTKQELEAVKSEHQKVSDELESIKDKSLSEKRALLIKKGVSEEEVKSMSEEALTATARVLGSYKPKPDLGGGGGGTQLKGTPIELAREAYSK